MPLISQEAICKVLTAYNPWWKTGMIARGMSKSYRRFAFYDAMRRLSETTLRRTVVLTGARRVGKTTIQYQMIEALLAQGVAPQKIVFISLDHPMLKLSAFQAILDCYHEMIYAGHDVYYFFDEIQYASDWDRWLKTLYDMQPDSHIVATGSASPAIVRGSEESGTGRWSIISVPTLSFYEYCALLQVSLPDLAPDLKLSTLFSLEQQERQMFLLLLADVHKHFIRYLRVGGFPELALADNDMLAQQILREDVVDKVLKRDLPALYNIRNATELERIFLYLCNVSSEIVSVEAIAKELNGVSRPTVENYIRYLESGNLIYQSWPVEMAGKKILKAQPKIYIADAAIRNAVLMDDAILTDPVQMGKIVETTVYKHTAAFYYQKATSVGYFRGGRKNKEIDIVIERPRLANILIEVKYRENAAISDDDAISELAAEAAASFILTKNLTDCSIQKANSGASLLRIPAFAFLYLLGHEERMAAATYPKHTKGDFFHEPFRL